MKTVPEYLSRESLLKQFGFICGQSLAGVSGVWKIDSGVPRPTLGTTLHKGFNLWISNWSQYIKH